MNEFLNIINLKTRNLPNVTRYSGNSLIQSESVSDHVSDMVALAIYLKYSIGIKTIDIYKLVYKINIHDYDECLYNDIPRDFKYHNEVIYKAINDTVNSLLSSNFHEDLINDIELSKNEKCIESIIVKALDVCQCTLKLYKEVLLLGNLSLYKLLQDNLTYLDVTINNVSEVDYIDEDDKDKLINKFLKIIYKKVKDDFSKLHI